MPAREFVYFVQQRLLLGVVPREELTQHEIPVRDHREPHQENGRGRKTARFNVQEEDLFVPVAAEESALRGIQIRHRFRQRASARSAGLGRRRGREPRELPEERRRPLSEIGVEPLVDEERSLRPLHHSAGQDLLDSRAHEVPPRVRSVPMRPGRERGRSGTGCRARMIPLLDKEVPEALHYRSREHGLFDEAPWAEVRYRV